MFSNRTSRIDIISMDNQSSPGQATSRKFQSSEKKLHPSVLDMMVEECERPKSQQNFGLQVNQMDPDVESKLSIQSNLKKDLMMKEGHKTFIKSENAFYIYHGQEYTLDIRSLYLFKKGNCLRDMLVWLVKWQWFENFIILCIIANSILLTQQDMTNYYNEDADQTKNDRIQIVDDIFTYIFTAECVFKVIAIGFYKHKNSYLKDSWNILDFFIVIISLLSLLQISENEQLKVLRAARILRPLKTISSVASMRRLIQTFFHSIPGLFNVFLFLTFFFSIFAIFGVLMFNGSQYNFCRETEEWYLQDGSYVWPIAHDIPYLC